MSDISRGLIGGIYALVKKLNLNKEDVVLGASEGRTEHVSELTMKEGIALMKYLKSQDPEEVECEKKRRTIISMAHELGYRKPGTTKVDMVKLDNWCVKYGKHKKKLNSLNLAQLEKLRWQFKQYHDSELKKF